MHRLLLIGLAVTLMTLGCRTPQQGGIPLGHWSGTGEFVAVASAPETQPAETNAGPKVGPREPAMRGYTTDLKISSGTGPAAGRIVFEILSMRGKIAGLDGDRTHLIMELEPAGVYNHEGVRLYRLVRGGLSSDAKPPTMEEGPSGRLHASCIRHGGRTALQVMYERGSWYDEFLFDGIHVYKNGGYVDGNDLIHWSEELTRK